MGLSMEKNSKHIGGFGPDDSERMEEYWDDNREDEDLPWHAKRTGYPKSKSKAKQRNNLRQSTPDTPGDEFMGDSDLE